MSDLKILIVNDFASVGYNLKNYLQMKVDIIYFHKDPVISLVDNPQFFINDNLLTQVKQIKDLSNKYDLFICFGWFASAICYLADVNYIIYFVDAYIDPKYRIWKKMPFYKKIFFSELFKDSLKYATKIIACDPNNASILRNYRSDIEVSYPMIDPQMFNSNVKKIDLDENKFVFLSPQRIEKDKGQLIMWEALNQTKSDFIVLQTDWGTGKYYEQVILNKPEKVKIIPKIPREKIPSYYVSCDSVLGQISPTTCGGVEREAILCGVPVFCYPQCGFTEDDPFYKKSRNPKEIAVYIDKIVEDKNFRAELKSRQKEWITKVFDNRKLSSDIKKILSDAGKINREKSKLIYRIIIKLYSITIRLNLNNLKKGP